MFVLSAATVSAQNDEPLVKFGLIADIQYADCEPQGSGFYGSSPKKLDDCVGWLNKENVRFTINLGDVVDGNFADFDSVLVRLSRLSKKIYNTTGNHDYSGVTDNKILYDKPNMPSEYYFFKKRNWMFVMLNTNEVASYSNITGTQKERELSEMSERIKASGTVHGATWNGGVSAKQLKWLDKLLAKAGKSGDKVLLFAHHPLYPQNGLAALNNTEILDVVCRYSCVKAIFAGRHHAGEFAYFKNIPVVTVEGMVETRDQNSFGIVKIYDDKITPDGYGRMSSREFNLH